MTHHKEALTVNQIWSNSSVYSGRPSEQEGRLKKELRTYDLLDRLEIPYARVDHRPADTIEDCAEVEQLLQIRICKNLFLCNARKSQFYLLMMPGDKRFRTADFSKAMGCSRLSFADASYMEQFLDITPGSVSVLGLMNDCENRVRLAIDSEILEEEYFGCHPCINTSSLKIKTSDLLEKILPAVRHEMTAVRL